MRSQDRLFLAMANQERHNGTLEVIDIGDARSRRFLLGSSFSRRQSVIRISSLLRLVAVALTLCIGADLDDRLAAGHIDVLRRGLVRREEL